MALYIISETYFQTSVWYRNIYDGLVSELKRKKITYRCIDDVVQAGKGENNIVFLLGTNIAWITETVLKCNEAGARPILLCGTQKSGIIPGVYSSVCADIEGSMKYILNNFKKIGAKKCALYGVNRLSVFNLSQREVFLNNTVTDTFEDDIFYNEGSLANCYNMFLEKADTYDAIISVNDFATVNLIKNLEEKSTNFLIAGYGGGLLVKDKYPKLFSISPGYNKFSKAAISIYEILKSNKDINSVSITIKYDCYPDSEDTEGFENKVSHTSAEKSDKDFYTDNETQNMVQIENMLNKCDEMDFTILKMLTKDTSYEKISESLFCSVNTIKYRIKKMKEYCMCDSKKELISIMKNYLNG